MGQTPAELFLKRSLKARLDMLHPDGKERVFESQGNQMQYHDKSVKERNFVVGQKVMARDCGKKWKEGVIVQQHGPLLFSVLVKGTMFWKRHVEQLRDCTTEHSVPCEEVLSQPSTSTENSEPSETVTEVTNVAQNETVEPSNESNSLTEVTEKPTPCRYPRRIHRKPPHFQ